MKKFFFSFFDVRASKWLQNGSTVLSSWVRTGLFALFLLEEKVMPQKSKMADLVAKLPIGSGKGSSFRFSGTPINFQIFF